MAPENKEFSFNSQPESVEIYTTEIPVGSTYLRWKAYYSNDVNTIITNFYQVGPITIHLNALIDLLLTTAEEPLFDILRTKEQLGYDVSCTDHVDEGVSSYSFTINSQENKFSVDHIDERIENFRKELGVIIENMPDKDFQQYKESLIQMKLIADNDLKDEIVRNWAEVTTDEYIFDRAQKEIAALQTIRQSDLLDFYLSTCGENTRKLSVQIIGNPNGNSEAVVEPDKMVFERCEIVELSAIHPGVLIRDIEEFKKAAGVYPKRIV